MCNGCLRKRNMSTSGKEGAEVAVGAPPAKKKAPGSALVPATASGGDIASALSTIQQALRDPRQSSQAKAVLAQLGFTGGGRVIRQPLPQSPPAAGTCASPRSHRPARSYAGPNGAHPVRVRGGFSAPELGFQLWRLRCGVSPHRNPELRQPDCRRSVSCWRRPVAHQPDGVHGRGLGQRRAASHFVSALDAAGARRPYPVL